MPNLKDIKLRIKSIKNTQKITQAMKMVAAAKVKKAENAVKASRPFSQAIKSVFVKVYNATKSTPQNSIKSQSAIENYPVLLSARTIKTAGILAITSSNGLAGAYNANIVRKTIARIKELKEQNLEVKLFIIGQKGINGLKDFVRKNNIEVINTYTKLPQNITIGATNLITEEMAEHFVSENIDSIEVITTKFKSMLSFIPEIVQVLPVQVEKETKEIPHQELGEAPLHSEMLFEPSAEDVLKKIVPLYLSNSIYQAYLEAQASELASRMTAMSNATTNAEDMIRILTIDYNKARQGAITQELLEVVSGANALGG
jgi:F-type H+-transporting ATPase subunit gamma